MPFRPAVFPQPPFPDHELLDFGEGERLERFGELVLARPEPQALGAKRLAAREWERRAHLSFARESDRGGRWEARSGAPAAARRSAEASKRREAGPDWPVRYGGATLLARATPFKHVGIFPEQAASWEWVRRARGGLGVERPRLLHLFGYTGAASVLAALAGYEVTHVDASRASLAWARENAAASGLAGDALRIVLEDALAFARREARRGNAYHGILVDPPHYGRGPKGEKWSFERDLPELLGQCRRMLAERSFLVISAYAIGILPLVLANLLAEIEGGEVESGELALREAEIAGAPPPRLLSCGLCGRWRRGVELAGEGEWER